MSDYLFDVYVIHQTRLERAKAGEARRIKKFMKEFDKKIIELVDSLPANFTKKQQDAVVKKAVAQIEKFYAKDVSNYFLDLAKDVVDVESKFSLATTQMLLANPADAKTVAASEILEIGMKKSYQKHKMSTWNKKLGIEKSKRLKKTLSAARIQELKHSEVLKTVRRQFGIANNHSATIAQSHINHFSSITRDRFTITNPDSASIIIWSSILDSATTVYCNDRSEKAYDAKTKEPIGHSHLWMGGPGAIHFGCRALGIPARPGKMPESRAGDRSKKNEKLTSLALTIRT